MNCKKGVDNNILPIHLRVWAEPENKVRLDGALIILGRKPLTFDRGILVDGEGALICMKHPWWSGFWSRPRCQRVARAVFAAKAAWGWNP